MTDNLKNQYPEYFLWLSVLLGVLSLIPFIIMVVLPTFFSYFYIIAYKLNKYFFYFNFIGLCSGLAGVISGTKSLKLAKNMAIFGIALSIIGTILSIFIFLIGMYLANF